jgi:hypothetical protein
MPTSFVTSIATDNVSIVFFSILLHRVGFKDMTQTLDLGVRILLNEETSQFFRQRTSQLSSMGYVAYVTRKDTDREGNRKFERTKA